MDDRYSLAIISIDTYSNNKLVTRLGRESLERHGARTDAMTERTQQHRKNETGYRPTRVYDSPFSLIFPPCNCSWSPKGLNGAVKRKWVCRAHKRVLYSLERPNVWRNRKAEWTDNSLTTSCTWVHCTATVCGAGQREWSIKKKTCVVITEQERTRRSNGGRRHCVSSY